jgi:hypothetical protein
MRRSLWSLVALAAPLAAAQPLGVELGELPAHIEHELQLLDPTALTWALEAPAAGGGWATLSVTPSQILNDELVTVTVNTSTPSACGLRGCVVPGGRPPARPPAGPRARVPQT